MIDFRYHLVSIVAVFLALAVGIVLGASALHGPVQASTGDDLGRVTSEEQDLEGDVSQLRDEVDAADAFALAVAPRLVRGALEDERVLLVTTPATPADLVERLTPLLEQAGAQLTGTLELLPALSDPAQRALVEDLVAQVVPAGVALPDTDAVGRATAELAAALTSAEDGSTVEPEDAQAVVAAFREAELVEFSSPDDTLRPATLGLVLAGTAPEALPALERLQQSAVVAMAGALDARGAGAVLAGPTGSADDRGTVRALRSEPALSPEVSSVDDADRGSGLVTVVLSLAEQRRGGVGQYGTGEGASTAPPRPAAP